MFLCFKQALFMQSKTTAMNKLHTTSVVKTLSEKWRLREIKCPATKHVLILQRDKTRRIRNVDTIVDHLREHMNASVQVVQFEGKPAQEQARIIHCANVFIAVQGAGMNWYKFLPPKARMLEITWPYWGSRYAGRVRKQRPDVTARVVKCQMYTSPAIYMQFAREWLPSFEHANSTWLTPNVTQSLLKRSFRLDPIKTNNIQKSSDCECTPESIYKAVTS